ncbi:MAG TPA: D-glycerate dehydrogenase [Solirubrobacteraceae bacterium]|nr:D-glycerate dehydrogenase [Solirubrobacteraceae bacterium]
MNEPRVVVAGRLPAAGLDLLRAHLAVELAGDGDDAAPLWAQLPGAAAMVVRPSIAVDADLLDRAGPSLKIVSSFGVGFDHIDLDAARARGVRVTNTPGVLTDATAELAVALMLAVARRVAEGDSMVRRGEWRGTDPEAFLGRSLVGATIGLIGFGRIGRRVAQLLSGFDARVLFFDDGAEPAHGAQRCGLAELLARADVVSLHVALTPQTVHLIDADALAAMRSDAILVNASRGAVVDTVALIEALRTGQIAAAGLDVYEDEPNIPSALRESRNTVLLPHIGSATQATRDAMARLCAENVIAVIDGREPPAAVV